jgi:signal peptidase II
MFAQDAERCLRQLRCKDKIAGLAAAALVLALDQVSKLLARGVLMEGIPHGVISSFVRFTLRYNSGAAFSLGWGGPVFLSVFTAIACFFLVRYMLKLTERVQVLWIGVILGGAIGNLTDRLLMGKVTDFIDIGLNGWRWPTFNVADIAICIGGIAVFFLFRGAKRLEVPVKETEK